MALYYRDKAPFGIGCPTTPMDFCRCVRLPIKSWRESGIEKSP